MLKRDVLRKEIHVEHAEENWSSHDGLNLYSQSWFPENSVPKAIINLIHGLGEHSGRYKNWATQFVEAGYAVRSFDLRGHGQSGGRRGYTSKLNKLIHDIDDFILLGKEKFPGTPVFNYGHSMGGNLILNHNISYKTTVTGMIITSPWLELKNPPPPINIILTGIIGNMFPRLTVKNRIKAEDLSHDLRIVHTYKTDPLVHNRISLKLYRELNDTGIRLAMSIYKINIPMLVMHGSSDNITSYKASRNFVQNASKLTSYIEWENGYHELHNDLDNEKVFMAISRWLDTQLREIDK